MEPFGGETLADVVAALPSACEGTRTLPAALRFGLETARLDLDGRRRGVPLLGTEGEVSVNATIGAASDERAADAARRAVDEGFGCVKLKVGMAGSTAAEAQRVRLVRDAIGPATLLRLDANGAWEVDEAVAAIRAVERFGIELVEQPVARLADLARVRRTVGVPIAADEAVTSAIAAEEILRAEAADLLVVKPAVVGGLSEGRRILALAPGIVTTTVESGVGVAAALHLAATIEAPQRHCGLATVPLLADGLVGASISVVGGRMRVPDGPGLGVTPRAEALTWQAA